MFGMGLTLKASDFAAVFTRPKDVFIGAVAQFMTPLLTLLYAGKTVDVNAAAMFLSVLKVVLLPILLGFVVNHFFGKFTEKAAKALPLVSTTAIVLIIAAVVSVNSQRILTSGLLILAVVVCHKACRTPDLRQALRRRTSHSIRLRQSPARYSLYGIIFPVRFLRTSSIVRTARSAQRRVLRRQRRSDASAGRQLVAAWRHHVLSRRTAGCLQRR